MPKCHSALYNSLSSFQIGDSDLQKLDSNAVHAIRTSRGGTLYVGTIRMGFGHHRIAYSACSWGLDAGMITYFHDLLNIKSREASIIKRGDA